MTKAEERLNRKATICINMYETAVRNNKNVSYSDICNLADRLHRMESTLTHLAEDECNYPKYDSAKQERIEKLAEKLITDNIGCECYTQRDPRGFCIRMKHLVDVDGNEWYNTWGQDTGLDW